MSQSVAIVGPFPPLRGGISHHTARLAEALEARGASVDRVSWAAQYPARLYGAAQRDATAPVTPGVSWILRWWNPISWFRAGMRARQRDLVVLPWVTPVHGLPQLFVLVLARRAQRIVHVHNVLPHEPMPFARSIARLVLRRADRLLCHSSALAAELRQLGIAAPIDVVSLPPTIPVQPSPLPPSPPCKLLFLGMIRVYKGLDIAVAAVEQLHRLGHPVELTIGGELWASEGVPSEADLSASPAPISAVLRYLSDSEVVELLSNHHILLAPYRSATQSGVVSLALAAGRPVVATRVGGLTDIVVDGGNGAIADPESVSSFLAATIRAMNSLELLAAGAAATPLSWSDYARAVLARDEPGDGVDEPRS